MKAAITRSRGDLPDGLAGCGVEALRDDVERGGAGLRAMLGFSTKRFDAEI
jgi:hypothetical protein